MITKMFEPCSLCGNQPKQCLCPVCPRCGMVGDIYCLDNHYTPQLIFDDYWMSRGMLKFRHIIPLIHDVPPEYERMIMAWHEWHKTIPTATHNFS